MMNEKTNNNLVDNINNLQSNNEIKLRFAFTTGEAFFIDCKNEEKLSDIINRFKEIISNFPDKCDSVLTEIISNFTLKKCLFKLQCFLG